MAPSVCDSQARNPGVDCHSTMKDLLHLGWNQVFCIAGRFCVPSELQGRSEGSLHIINIFYVIKEMKIYYHLNLLRIPNFKSSIIHWKTYN